MLAPVEAEWAEDRLSIARHTEEQDARSSPEKNSQHVGQRRQLISHGWKDLVTMTTTSVKPIFRTDSSSHLEMSEKCRASNASPSAPKCIQNPQK